MKAMVVSAIALCCIPLMAQQPSAADTNAQNSAALEQHIRELEERVIALEGKLRTMESQQAAQAQPAQPQPPAQVQPGVPQATQAEAAAGQAPTTTAPSVTSPNEAQAGFGGGGAQLPIYGGNSAASKALNPDVSVIGDFIGSA